MLTLTVLDVDNGDEGWGEMTVDLPANCRDPQAINQALSLAVGEDLASDEQSLWEIVTARIVRDSLLIITQDGDRTCLICVPVTK